MKLTSAQRMLIDKLEGKNCAEMEQQLTEDEWIEQEYLIHEGLLTAVQVYDYEFIYQVTPKGRAALAAEEEEAREG